MTAVSSYLTFPNLQWWMSVVNMDKVLLDKSEHFEKMSWRNRYKIGGANNSILLSVPLINGRNQRVAMKNVQVFNDEKWQVQHMRTIISVYRRSPYFEHYEQGLLQLISTPYTHLTDFNKAGLIWAQQQLGLKFSIEETEAYVKNYDAGITDLRHYKDTDVNMPKYYQVFEDRTGFVPNLSILDLLFSEGPFAVDKLKG